MDRLRTVISRLLRLNGTPHGIALGFTLGLSLSLIPIPGLGMIVSIAMAPSVGANPTATYAGTAVVNPFTGPLIYFTELWLGTAVMGRALPDWPELSELSAREWMLLAADALPQFGLGGLLCAGLAAIVAYPTMRVAVLSYRRLCIRPDGDANG